MDSLFYFGADHEPLFGALHLPEHGGGASAGAVICPPLGFDNLASYRALRVLAQRLAGELGRPTLRFDWPGTGDSAGDPREPQLVQRSLTALELAVEELRRRTGVEDVALVGVGIGATLAVAAAAHGIPTAELVLWAPSLSGRAYVRELRAFHSLSRDGDAAAGIASAPLDEGSFEATGTLFSAETARDLGQLDLLALDLAGRGVRRALVVGRDGESPAEALVERLLAADVATTAEPGSGADELISDVTKLPQAVFDRIVGWLDHGEPRATRGGAVPAVTTAAPRDGIEERILTLAGPDGRLVGIETVPSVPDCDTTTWVVFPTTGVLRRAGPNRLWTSVARDLAARGLPSLRLDVHGVGDSDGPNTAATNLSTEYSPEVLASVRAAVAHLRERRGARRFVLAGLCSGAFSSIRTALAEPDVAGAMLVNLQTAFWTREDEVRTQAAYLRESVLRTDRWRQVLHGEVNVLRVSVVLGRMLGAAAARKARRLRRAAPPTAFDSVGEALENVLLELERRDVPLLFVYAEDDPGVDYLERHLGHGVDALRERRNVRVEMVAGAGHTFNPLWSQDVLRELLDELLGACGAAERPAPLLPST